MSIVLGLTGSIGMGKSTVAAMFRKEGVPVFDSDAVVRAMQGPGGSLIAAIETLHPGSTGAQGVDRARLGAAVMGDKLALRRLERLIHPEVEKQRRLFLRRHRAYPLVVADVPLLFEKGFWRRVDLIAVVSAPAWKQKARVLGRHGMNWSRFEQVRALQLADPIKRRRADFVIPTGGSLQETQAAVRRIIAACMGRGISG
ncbi:MAG TPA: dephospho-CoA kinase [Sphingomonas sp.]|uniref:dephospho-CoA kinase n=1 Tax=Sphingomonas sp. TaxID=28214 RepID=UPI002BB31108|nr:dephospho-CoA kinase [Sphingomonas sp.]HMI19919.1 dephospho-CoA kinase [Sphingomonas sp.]